MDPTDSLMAFLSLPGGGEMIILGIIGLLIFGNRLPEVAKSLGKSVVEFKKGLSGVQDEIERSVNAAQQADILPPPSTPSSSSESVPVTAESSNEPGSSSAEVPASSVESNASSVESPSFVESPTSEAAPDVTPQPEQAVETPSGALNRRMGPDGEWITDPG